MSYNRWTPQEYLSGGELYHYGVKGMKWHQHKVGSSVTIRREEQHVYILETLRAE